MFGTVMCKVVHLLVLFFLLLLLCDGVPMVVMGVWYLNGSFPILLCSRHDSDVFFPRGWFRLCLVTQPH